MVSLICTICIFLTPRFHCIFINKTIRRVHNVWVCWELRLYFLFGKCCTGNKILIRWMCLLKWILCKLVQLCAMCKNVSMYVVNILQFSVNNSVFWGNVILLFIPAMFIYCNLIISQKRFRIYWCQCFCKPVWLTEKLTLCTILCCKSALIETQPYIFFPEFRISFTYPLIPLVHLFHSVGRVWSMAHCQEPFTDAYYLICWVTITISTLCWMCAVC